MSEMMERLAKTLGDSLQTNGDADIRAGLAFIDLKLVVRDVIEAMLEPTPEMVKAGTISWDPMDGGPIRPVFEPTKPYQAMIRAALIENESETKHE